MATGETSRLHANMGVFLILFFFYDAEMKNHFYFIFPLFDGTQNIASGQDCFPFVYPLIQGILITLLQYELSKKKKIKKECCSSITVKPQHFFVLVMSTFAALLLFVVVLLSENGNSYLFRTKLHF